MQDYLGITYSSNNAFFQLLFRANTFHMQMMMLLLVTGLLFFTTDGYVATKVLYITMGANVAFSTLQFLSQTPRPFWTDPAIVSFYCNPCFDNPDLTVFNYLFLFQYTRVQLKVSSKHYLSALLTLLLLAYLSLSVLGG